MPPVQDADVTAMRDASVKITRAAYQKMSLYARLITEITGLNLECGGLLLDPSAAQDGVTRDIYLLPDQEVTESAGHFGNDSLMQAYGHLKKTRVQVLGLWHSHGSYPPFHSTPDRGTINRVYSFNAKVCPLEQGVERMFLANSIVVNKETYDRPSVNRAGRQFQDPLSDDPTEGKQWQDSLPLEVVDEPSLPQEDPRVLVQELGERVRCAGRRLDEFPNFSTVLASYTPVEVGLESVLREEPPEQPCSMLEASLRHEPRTPAERTQQGFNYQRSMRAYSHDYDRASHSSLLAAEMGKVLAGDYRKNGKRVWQWTDRVREFLAAYAVFQRHATAADFRRVKGLRGLLKRHRYLRKKHPALFKQLEEHLAQEEKNDPSPR